MSNPEAVSHFLIRIRISMTFYRMSIQKTDTDPGSLKHTVKMLNLKIYTVFQVGFVNSLDSDPKVRF